MFTATFRHIARLSTLCLVLMCSAGAILAQTTTFSYQGRLLDGSTPANGSYDLQFALWDSLSGGTQIGSTQTLSGVSVANGIFTVTLDFGANAFPGASRFLEISARASGGGSFTLLSPRQQITSTPYAVRSLGATAADGLSSACVGCVTVGNGGTGLSSSGTSGSFLKSNGSTWTSAALSSTDIPSGSGSYIQNTTTQQSSSNFNVSGNGTAGGTLSGNIVNTATQYNLGGSRFASAAGFANTFVGLVAGLSNTGTANSFFGFDAGANNTTASGNCFFGYNAGANNTGGGKNTFVGASAGISNTTEANNTSIGALADGAPGITNATAIGANSFVTQSNSLVLGSINGVNLANADTRVGIGTTGPAFRLHVVDPSNQGLRVQTNTAGGLVASYGGNGDFQIDAPGVPGGRFLVKENGRIGIGTTAPLGKLQVVTANDSAPATITAWDSRHFVVGAGASTGGIGMSYDQTNNVGYIEALSPGASWRNLVFQSGGGNVGIGTTGPDALLTVNGTADKPGGGSWSTFSDERLKNVTGRFTPGLNAVMQLQPLRYEYKRDNALGIKSDGEHIGFGAQAVQQIIPEAVTKDDKGYVLVNNDPIIWTMLNAIKEQQKEIETLRAANATLNKRLQSVERSLRRRGGSARR